MKKETVKYLGDEALVEIESGLRDIWVNGSSSDNEAHCWIDPGCIANYLRVLNDVQIKPWQRHQPFLKMSNKLDLSPNT